MPRTRLIPPWLHSAYHLSRSTTRISSSSSSRAGSVSEFAVLLPDSSWEIRLLLFILLTFLIPRHVAGRCPLVLLFPTYYDCCSRRTIDLLSSPKRSSSCLLLLARVATVLVIVGASLLTVTHIVRADTPKTAAEYNADPAAMLVAYRHVEAASVSDANRATSSREALHVSQHAVHLPHEIRRHRSHGQTRQTGEP